MVSSKGDCQLKGHRQTVGIGQKEPYENQVGQMPNARNTWAMESLHSWSVALGKNKKQTKLGFVSDSELA